MLGEAGQLTSRPDLQKQVDAGDLVVTVRDGRMVLQLPNDVLFDTGKTELKPAGVWQFDVAADAFLYRMVRRLVFVQVAVAQGRCLRDAVLRALDRGVAGELPAGLAPAHGLELMQVDY